MFYYYEIYSFIEKNIFHILKHVIITQTNLKCDIQESNHVFCLRTFFATKAVTRKMRCKIWISFFTNIETCNQGPIKVTFKNFCVESEIVIIQRRMLPKSNKIQKELSKKHLV